MPNGTCNFSLAHISDKLSVVKQSAQAVNLGQTSVRLNDLHEWRVPNWELVR